MSRPFDYLSRGWAISVIEKLKREVGRLTFFTLVLWLISKCIILGSFFSKNKKEMGCVAVLIIKHERRL